MVWTGQKPDHTPDLDSSMRLFTRAWVDQFDDFVGKTQSSLTLVSPFITRSPLLRVKKSLPAGTTVKIEIITNLHGDNLSSGSVDAAAIAELAESHMAVVRHLPGLHAKVFISDDARAIVTSSNLTDGGLYRNYEYGILIEDGVLVPRIVRDIHAYGSLGSSVSSAALVELSDVAASLHAQQRLAATITDRESRALRERIDQILMEARARPGETTNQIFARTIEYLLREKPLSTQEMHPLIQAIHPDLCDDQIDREINGVRFGKR
ncbi:MAG: phospholipase D family protein [Dehalococcoidia bacterium]